MTTHVFIVSQDTFRLHLKYMFAGTGADEKDVDFNDTGDSALYPHKKHSAEAGLVGMMADCARIRVGDLIVFYLQASRNNEGKFYGVFQATSEAFLDRNNDSQFLKGELKKSLTFRICISPYEVYGAGVTEWEALDDIDDVAAPYRMLWSLIYRKLKGNRGNTMITIYESERLIDLIRSRNNNIALMRSDCYDFDGEKIIASPVHYEYTGSCTSFNILPRLIRKHQDNKMYESHLQMYIVQNVGRHPSLDAALGMSGCSIEWIGNEVSCGVGMQRIDVMLSVVRNEGERVVLPIELKAVPSQASNLLQLERYIKWLEQYYLPNRTGVIQPVLICRQSDLSDDLKRKFNEFNAAAAGRYQPLKYIEYTIENNNIEFNLVPYEI